MINSLIKYFKRMIEIGMAEYERGKEKHIKSCLICQGKASGFCDASLYGYSMEGKKT